MNVGEYRKQCFGSKFPCSKSGVVSRCGRSGSKSILDPGFRLWEVIEEWEFMGLPIPVTTPSESGTSTGKPKMIVPLLLLTKEKRVKDDLKARSLLLMALPNEHQLTFDQYVDAQSMFAAIKAQFGGNEATKKTQKALLKQSYENFSDSSSESLDSIFNRRQRLVSRLAILGVVTSLEDLNVKFLRSLPSEWDTHVVVWMNKPDFDTIRLDDLYNNFKIVEQKVKKSAGASNDDKNLAFVTTSVELTLLSMGARRSIRELEGKSSLIGKRANTDRSTKAVKIEDASEKAMCAIDGAGFDWSDMAEEEIQVNMALMAFLNSEEIALLKRSVGGKEYQMGLLRTICEMLEVKISDKSKKGVGPKNSKNLRGFNKYGPKDSSLKPTIGCDKDFGRFAEATNDDNGEVQLTATIDGHSMTITEASLRRHLKLDDHDSVTSILNSEIFKQLALMGYHTDSDKLTFQKGSRTTFPYTNEIPLHVVHSHGSAEGSLKLNELMTLVTKLSEKIGVLEDDLKKTKLTYSAAVTKLILRVKKLETKLKAGTARKRARVVLSEDVEDDSSKQGRKLSDADVQYKSKALKLETYYYKKRRSEEGNKDKKRQAKKTPLIHYSKLIMTESEPKKKSKKELEQEKLSFAEAFRLQEQMDEEQRAQIARDEEIARQWDEEERQRAMSEAKSSKKIDWNDPSVIRPIFEKVWDFNQHIEPMDLEHGSERMKSPEKIEEEDVELDDEKEDLKGYLDMVPREDVAEDVESLSTKQDIMEFTGLSRKNGYYLIVGVYMIYVVVHILLMQNGIAIHMLTEKKYPLSQEMLSEMLVELTVTNGVSTASTNVVLSELGLESVEARLAHYKKNEAVYEESINVLNLEVKLRDNALVENKKKLEKAKKERDELKLTLEKFQNSSKSLNNLLESQVIDKFKTGLGYNAASSTAASPAVESFVNSSEMLENQEYNKSKSDKGYHAVPLPFTGNFIPRKPDLTFMDEIVESENMDVTTVVTPSNVKTVESNLESAGVKSNGDAVEPKTVRKNSFRPPVIEDWNSDDKSEKEYKEKGVIDSGCSRHMTRNKCYLTEYEDYDGGFVSFGDSKGRIYGKGKIKIGTLDFNNVYFCKELKYNLFSVSQICDKKNNVLFTDIEGLVLSSDFKLLDESQVC
ncbi:hypothetical protein Tco_0267175 [Tanacetum coccineum]